MRRPISLLIQPYDKPQASVSTTPVFYFGTSGAGKSVTAQTTIWLSTEHTCVEAISEAVASLPLREDEAKDASTMNMPPITMTNPADSHNNHSACAGERGLGAVPSNKQSAKGATFALLATMLLCCFRESMELYSRKKEISFRENFWPGNPSKTVISKKQTDAKMPTKPYAATLSKAFKM